jgi:hypothetical protein
MRDRNSSRRRTVRFLGLLLAFSATACNGGPTEPSFDELIRMYSGRWRGNINGLEVVLDVQASKGSFGFNFLGTGTARATTGEIHRLRIDGGALPSGDFAAFYISKETGPETQPGGVILTSTGRFAGDVSPDGRSWPGRFTLETALGAAPIFGVGEYSVTLAKD